jgi:small subunit ribosomal protein S6e
MAFKINIGTKEGKTYKLESEAPAIIGKELHETVHGKDISHDLEGYEFEITGASDTSGFPSIEDAEGLMLQGKLLTYGKGMKKRPRKEGKRKRSNPRPRGLRLRKTVRGKIISEAMAQINLKVTKEGHKKLADVFKAEAGAEEKKE